MREFYKRFRGGSAGTLASDEDVCPADSESTQDLINQNAVIKTRCGAVQLESLKEGLQQARKFIDILMKIIFATVNIVMDLMQLTGISSEDVRTLLYKNLLFWFQDLIVNMGEALKTLGTIIFKMIFENSPIGQALKDVMNTICATVAWIMNEVWLGFFCPIAEVVLPPVLNAVMAFLRFIEIILGVIRDIACFFNSCLPESASVQGAIDSIDTLKQDVETNGLGCDTPFNSTCFAETTYSLEDASLPTATRCWSGYQPAAGDSSVLSCTRADTCFDPTENEPGGNNQKLCDACAQQEGEDFLSFACSALTKRCTCGVQRFERTRCKSHQECYTATQGASCMRVDGIFDTAYSTTPCDACTTQPVCIVESTNSPGYCACPFTDVVVEQCSHVGEIVTPDPTKLCNVRLNGAILSTNNMKVSWKDLAVTSCAILDKATTYCYGVSSVGFASSVLHPSVVGFNLLSTGRRRRLLGGGGPYWSAADNLEEGEDDSLAHYMMWNASWTASGEPCRGLVHAYRSGAYRSGDTEDHHHGNVMDR